MAFMPQILRFLVDFWARLGCRQIGATPAPRHRRKYGSPVNAPVMKRLPESGLVRLASHSVFKRSGCRFALRKRVKTRDCRPVPEFPMLSVYVPSESSLKKLPETADGGIAGQRGLDRPRQADGGGGPRGGAAGRDRGADPGGHAGNRDFQPALYRERRPLHDRDADVPFRHRYAADHGGHLHPGRPSAGDRALRRAEAVCAGRTQAGAVMPAGDFRRNGADGIARRGDRPLRRHSGARRRRGRSGLPRHLRARKRAPRPGQALFADPDRDRAQGRSDLEGSRKPGLDRPRRHLPVGGRGRQSNGPRTCASSSRPCSATSPR